MKAMSRDRTIVSLIVLNIACVLPVSEHIIRIFPFSYKNCQCRYTIRRPYTGNSKKSFLNVTENVTPSDDGTGDSAIPV